MRHFLPCLLLVGLLWGCGDAVGPDSADLLVAKKITSADQLIGGPSARGKLGDYLLANGRVRFIISGEQPSYMGGTFGGTLVDADLQRGRADQRNGAGNDAFSESFPLVNLLVPNPNRPWGPGALTGALAFDSYIDNSAPAAPAPPCTSRAARTTCSPSSPSWTRASWPATWPRPPTTWASRSPWWASCPCTS